MKLKGYILFCLLGLFSISAFAQGKANADEQLAQQYFQDKEYEKAADLYAGLYKKRPDVFYSNYLQCLLQLKEYKTAEKIIKKQINFFSDQLSFYVDLGILYGIMGEQDKARKQFETSIDKLTANQEQIFSLANTFVANKL